MTKNITIFPIFNQAAPGVWDDFLRIRAAAMTHNYNLAPTDTEIAMYRRDFLYNWRKRSTNIAFGAFDGTDMIGFAYAACLGNRTELDSLYVLPEYQHLHIGTRLLYATESAAQLYTNNMELVSLAHAEPFYCAKSYKSLSGNNRYTKNIQGKGRCACVPVFNCSAKIARACQNIAPDFKIDAFAGAHLPMYVYIDVDGNILGYAAANPATNRLMFLKTKCNHPADWSRRALTNEMRNYIAHRELLLSK